jgi:hypothetical protein
MTGGQYVITRQRFSDGLLMPTKPKSKKRLAQTPRPGGLIHIDIKKLGHFEQVGHRMTGIAPANPTRAASAGSSSMSSSMMPPVLASA